jgi:hypothetical protein
VNDRVTGARRALRRWFGPAGLTTRSISDVVAPHGWFVRCGRGAPSASTASPETAAKPRSTFVNASLPLNERGERFTMRFVFRIGTEHARPF